MRYDIDRRCIAEVESSILAFAQGAKEIERLLVARAVLDEVEERFSDAANSDQNGSVRSPSSGCFGERDC